MPPEEPLTPVAPVAPGGPGAPSIFVKYGLLNANIHLINNHDILIKDIYPKCILL
jgi:hypothetical protein